MGILGNILGRNQVTTTSGATADSANTALSSVRDGANAMLSRGVDFYKQNPRKVQMAGLLAAAALLTRMSRR